MKKLELIAGIVAGVTVGMILSPKKIYELKSKSKENYDSFILENGPITKEMLVNYFKEKRAIRKIEDDNEIIEDIEESEQVLQETVSDSADIVTDSLVSEDEE